MRREGEAERLFKELIAENFPNWGRNWIHKSMKLRELLVTSMQKTFSKTCYIKTVKSHNLGDLGTSLVVKWLRICLPMQGTREATCAP